MEDSKKSLKVFDAITAQWFDRAIGTPTAVQEAAWPVIASGNHTLVSAPTGTGKTLSAFLVFIDRLKSEARQGILKNELQLIYVSPLKSLAGDIRENLRRPLDGIAEEERRLSGIASRNPQLDNVLVSIRTGDTPQNERRRMIKTPPHILITTPESLYLMMSSKSGKSILRTARWIILDELHAMIDTKRGAHLMLSIARLDKLCPKPLQRIGLSATIEPLSVAADYLAPDPVTIVAPKMRKDISVAVTTPTHYTNDLRKESVWQDIANTVYDHCKGTRSVIAFVEGRAYAERLAYYVNQLAGDGFARTHHGSMSKAQRLSVEEALRDGNLRLLCATSSMELGIDVGEIDQVFQVGCPRTISSTMQRLGRAGHNPGRVSVMHIFPRVAAEALYCGLTAEVVRNGGIEYSHPPRLCLDVLAQHLVSMAVDGGYHLDEVMEMLPRAYPFRDVTRDDVRDVLCMLAGDHEHHRDMPVRPRVLYDRIHERVEGDAYSRMLAVSAGGTIPDKGLYTVRTDTGVKLGELDEEFVFEARVGDKFLLGTFGWQIASIQKDAVIVAPSSAHGARPPFWKGEIKGRGLRTGKAFGEIFRRLGIAHETGALYKELQNLGLDEEAAKGAQDIIRHQVAVTGGLPDDRTILIEHFRDETGNHQMMVHSMYGRAVNEPLSILVGREAQNLTNTSIHSVVDDDGFLLFPYHDCPLPKGLLTTVSPDTAPSLLTALLPATPLFNMAFRYNTARALMMGVRKAGRQPLWVQRMRSADMLEALANSDAHPLIRETKRECLEDYWDLQGVVAVLEGIRAGTIHVREMVVEAPSPMSFLLRRQAEGAMMYDYTPTPPGIHVKVNEALQQAQMIQPSPEHLALIFERRRLPENENQLHSLLMMEGDLIAGELSVPIEWLETIAAQGRAKYIEPGLWIAAEHEQEYAAALSDADVESRMHIVRRSLRYRGAQTVEQIADRYLWTEDAALSVLTALCNQGRVVEQDGLYYHAELYERARHETVKSRRRQMKTLPSERYAALMANRMQITAPPEERLEAALRDLCGQPFPAALWESVLLPARVSGYRPELLDKLLSQGNYLWRFTPQGMLCFERQRDIDWDADLCTPNAELEEEERIICDALLKRGASFVQRLTDLVEGSPFDALMSLAEKGLAYADSFMPVRQWLNRGKLEKGQARQRVRGRVMAMTSGRWELVRPIKELTAEHKLDRLFDQSVILSRETVQGLSWSSALEVLRVWEYTGRVRRGYFVEGLSGVQFIREKDYAGVIHELESPEDITIWLTAIDPSQQWGKSLPHKQDRAFIIVPGTVVALRAGVPVAVFERQGKVLRVFDPAFLSETLRVFARDFSRKMIYPSLKRMTTVQYPAEAADALLAAGFHKEMQEFVLYR